MANMKILQNENTLDRLIRIFLAELFLIIAYYWTGGMIQIIFYVLAVIMLLTAATGFCALYLICKCSTKTKFPKPLSKKISIPIIVFLIAYPFVGGYYSGFFSRKFFLEDFNRMNNFYKQTLFNTGQDKRAESIDNYEKLVNEYAKFSAKYQAYHPAALKSDKQLNSDLQSVGNLIAGARDQVYNGDLKSLHTKFEEVRPVFQSILKRNNFSMLGVALVDFHDAMEKAIAASDEKNADGVIAVYPEIDEKLKTVEAEANDGEIQSIRKNLEDLLALAKNGKNDDLAKKAAELKSSFVKVYLKRG